MARRARIAACGHVVAQGFETVESLTSVPLAVTVNAKDEDINPSFVAFNDFRQAFRFQSFPDAAKQRVLTNVPLPKGGGM